MSQPNTHDAGVVVTYVTKEDCASESRGYKTFDMLATSWKRCEAGNKS